MSFCFRAFIASLILFSASTLFAEFCVSAEQIVPQRFFNMLIERIDFFDDMALHPERHEGGYAPCLWDAEKNEGLDICVRCDEAGTNAIKCFVMFPNAQSEFGMKSWLSFLYTRKALLMANKQLHAKINATNPETGPFWIRVDNPFGSGRAYLDCTLERGQRGKTSRCVITAMECVHAVNDPPLKGPKGAGL